MRMRFRIQNPRVRRSGDPSRRDADMTGIGLSQDRPWRWVDGVPTQTPGHLRRAKRRKANKTAKASRKANR